MIYPPEDVPCVHVDCADHDGINRGCRYQPPAIGPQVPRQVRDAEGGLWTTHGDGKVYYRQLPADDPSGRRYELATWPELVRHAAGETTRYDRLPPGPWEVTVP